MIAYDCELIFVPPVSVASSSYPDERVRYWNGYLLFYERKIEEIRTPLSAKKSKMLMKRHQPDRLRYEIMYTMKVS